MKRVYPDNRRPQRGDPSGFSLVETSIVAALLGLLLAIGLPSYLNAASNQRVRTTASTLASDLHVARQEAVTRRATVTVRFADANGSCSSERPTASYAIAEATNVIKRMCLPPDVAWVSPPPASVKFRPTGAPEAGMSVRVQSSRTGITYTVLVAAETGVITDDTR